MSTLTYKIVNAVGETAKDVPVIKIGLHITICFELISDGDILPTDDPVNITFEVLDNGNLLIFSGKCTLKEGDTYWFSEGDGPDGSIVGNPPHLNIVLLNDKSVRFASGCMIVDQYEAYNKTYVPENLEIDEIGQIMSDQKFNKIVLRITGDVEHEYTQGSRTNDVLSVKPFCYIDENI